MFVPRPSTKLTRAVDASYAAPAPGAWWKLGGGTLPPMVTLAPLGWKCHASERNALREI